MAMLRYFDHFLVSRYSRPFIVNCDLSSAIHIPALVPLLIVDFGAAVSTSTFTQSCSGPGHKPDFLAGRLRMLLRTLSPAPMTRLPVRSGRASREILANAALTASAPVHTAAGSLPPPSSSPSGAPCQPPDHGTARDWLNAVSTDLGFFRHRGRLYFQLFSQVSLSRSNRPRQSRLLQGSNRIALTIEYSKIDSQVLESTPEWHSDKSHCSKRVFSSVWIPTRGFAIVKKKKKLEHIHYAYGEGKRGPDECDSLNSEPNGRGGGYIGRSLQVELKPVEEDPYSGLQANNKYNYRELVWAVLNVYRLRV
ncbi:hypothetical protein B0H19DRAFT_1229791 [Mycena capillaripes]|nr:hypothetical protein B0H19DRAFT_1229791 [Mycena capillaripes]